MKNGHIIFISHAFNILCSVEFRAQYDLLSSIVSTLGTMNI